MPTRVFQGGEGRPKPTTAKAEPPKKAKAPAEVEVIKPVKAAPRPARPDTATSTNSNTGTASSVTREANLKLKKAKAPGKTLSGILPSDEDGASCLAFDDDDLTDPVDGQGSIGVGRYLRTLNETRDAVFHCDPPKVEVFTYVNHKQVFNEASDKPIAYDNFLSTQRLDKEHRPKSAGWQKARDHYFLYTRIGSKNDDPTVFAKDADAQRDAEERAKFQAMSARQRRASLAATRASPAPLARSPKKIQFRDASFLQKSVVAAKLRSSDTIPSVFQEHPRDLFIRSRDNEKMQREYSDDEEEDMIAAMAATSFRPFS